MKEGEGERGSEDPVHATDGEMRTRLGSERALPFARRTERSRRTEEALNEDARRPKRRGCYGRSKVRRSSVLRRPAGQVERWSLTRPMACMSAYIVVGPTNVQPRRFSSLLMASAWGEV